MGNIASANSKIPRYLRPVKPSKAIRRKYAKEKTVRRKLGSQELQEEIRDKTPAKVHNTSEDESIDHDFDPLPSDSPSNQCAKWVEGRRFHLFSTSVMPNDYKEMDRIELEHELFKILFDGNYNAPVSEMLEHGKALDLGCATGAWLKDMAKDFPGGEFYGIDITDAFPRSMVPNNIKFEVGDVTTGLPYSENFFDFVLCRNFLSTLRITDWPNVFMELVRVTKPGGWIQMVELELPMRDLGPVGTRLWNQFMHAMRARDLYPTIAHDFDNLFNVAGFEELSHYYFRAPLGEHGGLYGKLWLKDMTTALRAVRSWLSAAMGLNKSDYNGVISEVVNECETVRAHISWHVAYARKPLASLGP